MKKLNFDSIIIMASSAHKNTSAKKAPLKKSTFNSGRVDKADKCNVHLLKLSLLKKYIEQLELRLKDRRLFEESLKELDSLNLTAA